ncbi:MAG: DUF2282 domain-containing protein [Alphaproteobacteria bacterium]|nr:DUF2282 domain-containing protein [Alphaproteobacteria bacterium]
MSYCKKAFILSTLLSVAPLASGGDPRDALPDCDEMNPTEGVFCKCYGSALKGQNDCTNKAGTHGCGGASQIDCDVGEYKVVESTKCTDQKTLCLKQKDNPSLVQKLVRWL